MGIFQWLMKKVTKVFGRGTNALFYTLLYREIGKEVQLITKDEEKTLKIVREIGKRGALDSCERHSGIFKFMPATPDKVLDYFGILWSVVFGMDFGEHEYEEIPKEGHLYNDYLLKIKKCPICGGYGDDPEDTFSFENIKGKDTEGLACGLCGMLQSVANYILKVKGNEYRIGIVEQKCMAKGEDQLEFICKIYNLDEWRELQGKRSKEGGFDADIREEDFMQKSKMDMFDQIQDFFSLDKLEKYIDEPLENVKDKVSELIRDNFNMEPEHFFDYFRNYEDDMVRVIGYLGVHLMNEYGGLVEKIMQNDLFAKIIGYMFKQFKEMVLLFVPLDVINDYQEFYVDFLDGIAPPEMIDNIKEFSGKDNLMFILEGAQKALEDLGIDFSELKENIWEELKKERQDGLIDSDQSVVDKSREAFPQIIKIVQEIMMLVNEILTIPVRVIISESHHGLKTAVNSVVSEEEGLFGSIKDHADKIFDYVQELRT